MQGSDLQVRNWPLFLEGLTPGDVTLEAHLRTDMWHYWLSEAIEAASRARHASEAVVAAVAAGDQDSEIDHQLGVELRASMRAITAAAFAVDAFYASVKARSPAHPHQAVWRANRTSRPAQICETLRYHLKLKPEAVPVLRTWVHELFMFRGWAVHPGSKYREAIFRADVDSGLDWHFIAFRSENAVACVANTVQSLDALTVVLYRGCDELKSHKPAARGFIARIVNEYLQADLPEFEWTEDRDVDLPRGPGTHTRGDG